MEVVAGNVRAALADLGAGPADVVMARVYVVDLTPERLDEMMPGFRALFGTAQPSVTGIGVAALAAPELQIELELVVRLPD
jgi:enamine deaminase RidA (YjgF/YER057c/UK114 family)